MNVLSRASRAVSAAVSGRSFSAQVLDDFVRPVVDPAIYTLRGRVTNDLLSGSGLEIGAGLHPQELPPNATCVYFDKLDAEALCDLFGASVPYSVHPIGEIGLLFPAGADFLIAHNVLEHSADPISTLMLWMSHVKPGGIVIISIPDKHYCPGDADRVVPPLEHILLDFLSANSDDSFESREHILSFLAGWHEYIRPGMSKSEYLAYCLSELGRSGHDLHWHAMDTDLAAMIIHASALLSKRSIRIVRTCTPSSEHFKTLGETIFAIQMDAIDPDSDVAGAVAGRIDHMARTLGAWCDTLSGIHKPSSP